MRVVMTLRPGARATKRLVQWLGRRLVAVRYRTSDAGCRVRTIEVVADAALLATLRTALSAADDRSVPEITDIRSSDGAFDDDIAPAATPCACAAVRASGGLLALTFMFEATAGGEVLATVQELPAVWAIGSTVDEARARVVVEVALALAANPPHERIRHEAVALLHREVVFLPPRTGAPLRKTLDRSDGA